jgi:hypothetical protein
LPCGVDNFDVIDDYHQVYGPTSTA